MQLEARTQEMLSVTMHSAHLPSEQSLMGNGSNQSIVHKLKSRGKAEQRHQVVKLCPWPTHIPFSLNPKGRLKAFFFLSDAQCPCQLINQEQKTWPCSATRMAKIVCYMNTKTRSRMAVHSMPYGSKPTFADGPVPHVARFAGTAVSLDSVGADGILITVVLPIATFIVLCLQGEKERDTFS